MNLTNPPKNFSLLFWGCVALGIMLAFTFLGLLTIPYIDFTNPKGVDPNSFPRNAQISAQIITMICLFALPPILFALFSKNDFLTCYNLDKKFGLNKYLLASIIALLLFPVIINFQHWTMIAPLPESLKTLAELQQAKLDKILEMFLNEPGLGNLGLMILMVGIGAGLTEELAFRGFLLPWIERITKSTWAAIILSAFFFSLIHLSVYTFIPIMVVGILLGYIYSKTRDLKLNIFIHALYNSAQVILNYLHENKFIEANLDEVKSIPILIWIICLSIVVFLIYKLVKDYEYLPHSS